jgi:histidine triad (HIT) family protein
MPADCRFCRIIGGELDAHVVFEDQWCLAFLDHRPLFPGHILLSPKQHVTTLTHLPAALIGPLFNSAKLLAKAVEVGLQAHGSFVAINNRISQSVPHLHIHIVPRHRKDGLKGFFWPRQPYRDEQHMVEVRNALCAAIAELDATGWLNEQLREYRSFRDES